MFANSRNDLWERALFVFAHMDDETISSYGTIRRMIADNAVVDILCMCGKGRDAHGGIDGAQRRRAAVFDEWRDLGARVATGPSYDLSLTREAAQAAFDKAVADCRPDVVVTHWPHDLHFEHRLVGEAAMVSCRKTPDCSVRQLWYASSPASKWSMGVNGAPFVPNMFVDISRYEQAKIGKLDAYAGCGEMPSAGMDLRSAESVMVWDRFNGRTVGLAAAEAYVKAYEVV